MCFFVILKVFRLLKKQSESKMKDIRKFTWFICPTQRPIYRSKYSNTGIKIYLTINSTCSINETSWRKHCWVCFFLNFFYRPVWINIISCKNTVFNCIYRYVIETYSVRVTFLEIITRFRECCSLKTKKTG